MYMTCSETNKYKCTCTMYMYNVHVQCTMNNVQCTLPLFDVRHTEYLWIGIVVSSRLLFM